MPVTSMARLRPTKDVRVPLCGLILTLMVVCPAWGGQSVPESASQQPETQEPDQPKPAANQTDPFSNVAEAPAAVPATGETRSWIRNFFTDNFGFRKEIMSQFDATEEGQPASRQSLGFEVLKKFSTDTATVASFDFQARLVRRDGYHPVLDDLDGQGRQGWSFEYDNLYLDLYNVFNPVLNGKRRARNVGRFNFRAGHFYVPFGLNLQTDTHGTVLQLSNQQNFGFDQDWYTGFWGSINRHLNYDAYYLAGSGYDLKFKGQHGLAAVRLSLANKYSSQYGLEGGISLIGGERLASEMPSGPDQGTLRRIETERAGLDGRYKRAIPTGLLTFTGELSGGRDVPNRVFTQLYQTDYLRASRRWGLAAQYRRFEQERLGTGESIIGEFSWYFRNDVGNSNLHWIKLNVERQLKQMQGRPATLVTLQYYFYR